MRPARPLNEAGVRRLVVGPSGKAGARIIGAWRGAVAQFVSLEKYDSIEVFRTLLIVTTLGMAQRRAPRMQMLIRSN